MTRSQFVFSLCILAAVTAIILIFNSCGSNRSIPSLTNTPTQDNQQITTPPPGNPQADTEQPLPVTRQPRNMLILDSAAIGRLKPGDEFDVVVKGRFIDEVYQGSARIAFDQELMRPVEAKRGSMLLSDMIHIAGINQPQHVPFSFTALPGNAGIAPGEGELLRIRFRLTGTPGPGKHIWLINEAEFLQLRDRQGQRLSFDLETREVR